MSRRPLISAKLPPELHAAVLDKMQSTGLTQSQAIIAALSAWVGLPGQDGDDRIAGIEQRLSALEQRSTGSTVVYPMRSEKVRKGPPPESTQSTGSTAVEADGGRWLTTQQGYAVATSRGYDGSASAWRSWSKRNPDQCEAQYQLRHISHGSRSNTAASFEDLGQD